MTSVEAVQYKRTTDMETLYQMLCKEQSITEAWHGFAEMIAKVVKAGVAWTLTKGFEHMEASSHISLSGFVFDTIRITENGCRSRTRKRK